MNILNRNLLGKISLALLAFSFVAPSALAATVGKTAGVTSGYGGGEGGGGEGGGGTGGGGNGGGGGGGGSPIGGGGGSGCNTTFGVVDGGFSFDVTDDPAKLDGRVALAMHVKGVSRMAISNTLAFTGVNQQPFAENSFWSLPDTTEGSKTVYVRFYDSCGNPTRVYAKTFDYKNHQAIGGTGTTGGQVLGQKITLVDELIAKLKFGQRNDDVKKLQDELARLGYMPRGWKSTNFYGTVTQAAIRKYLASKPVVAADIDALIKLVSFGQRNANVTLLQRAMLAKGLYKGPITGYFGVLTRFAVDAYLASKK